MGARAGHQGLLRAAPAAEADDDAVVGVDHAVDLAGEDQLAAVTGGAVVGEHGSSSGQSGVWVLSSGTFCHSGSLSFLKVPKEMPMFSLHQLRCFIATYEQGSLTAAAAELGYAQPS